MAVWDGGAAAGCFAAGRTRAADHAQRGASRDWRVDQLGAGRFAVEGGAAGGCGFARGYCRAGRVAGFDAAAGDVGAGSGLRVDERR